MPPAHSGRYFRGAAEFLQHGIVEYEIGFRRRRQELNRTGVRELELGLFRKSGVIVQYTVRFVTIIPRLAR